MQAAEHELRLSAEHELRLSVYLSKMDHTKILIKIKTLEGGSFTLQVEKDITMQDLKQRVASLTGIESDQQRLIFRGRFLEDNNLLSYYHVEDGHVIHLVVREPPAPSQASSSHPPAPEPRPSIGQNRRNLIGFRVGLTQANSEIIPDTLTTLSRCMSQLQQEFSANAQGQNLGGEYIGEQPVRGVELLSIVLSSTRALIIEDVTGYLMILIEQLDSHESVSEQSDRMRIQRNATWFGNLIQHLGSLMHEIGRALMTLTTGQLPADALIMQEFLITSSQHLFLLRQEFVAYGEVQNASVQDPNVALIDGLEVVASTSRIRTPQMLSEVVLSAHILLLVETSNCLMELRSRLESLASVTDPIERSRIQVYFVRSGGIFQYLGSSLLELGRAIMTLRMGQSSSNALVNAGPPVFVIPTGPNLMIFQPMPSQPGVRTESLFRRTEPTGSEPELQVAPLSFSGDSSGQFHDSDGNTKQPSVDSAAQQQNNDGVFGGNGSSSSVAETLADEEVLAQFCAEFDLFPAPGDSSSAAETLDDEEVLARFCSEFDLFPAPGLQ